LHKNIFVEYLGGVVFAYSALESLGDKMVAFCINICECCIRAEKQREG